MAPLTIEPNNGRKQPHNPTFHHDHTTIIARDIKRKKKKMAHTISFISSLSNKTSDKIEIIYGSSNFIDDIFTYHL